MKIYTKKGDTGETSFFGCGLMQKDDPRIEALGVLDELNSLLGLTLCFVEEEKLQILLKKIQNDLFTLGADLVGSQLKTDSLPRISDLHIREIEEAIDVLEDKLGMPKKFILPGGTVSSSFLHLCRATARRAERALVSAKNVMEMNPEIIRYTNRLSDFLYVLARDANKEKDIPEQQPIYKYFEKERQE